MMARSQGSRRQWLSRSFFTSLCMVTCSFAIPASAQIHVKTERLNDGVEHWYIQEPDRGDSFLTQEFAQIYSVVFSPQSARPFGRSVAFLVGVSKYQHLSQLPSVLNDVHQMRDFLLYKAGFDDVDLLPEI